MSNQCLVCLEEIKVMIRRGTGICGDICEKASKKPEQ